MRAYHTVDELVSRIDEPNRTACARILGGAARVAQNETASP
jgi:hypothetical protein